MDSETRRLAAIMFTDIAGYTARMGEDEGRALRLLERARASVRQRLPEFHGELIEEIGDGTLCSFQSAVEAVRCARAIQDSLRHDPDLRLRIGIHIGDVIFTGRQVVGDGVNVASRIQGLAEGGGICVSEPVYDAVRNQPDVHVVPLGEQRLKNVTRPVRVYALGSGSPATRVSSAAVTRSLWPRHAGMTAAAIVLLALGAAALYLRRAPLPRSESSGGATASAPTAVAVLPFSVRGGQELAYLGEGMVSLLGTKLDGAGGLRRVDPHSLLSFVKRHASGSADPEAGRTVAQQFGAGLYVLGSVVELPGRVHIEASLYDVARGDTPMAEASAEGEVTRLTDLVDALAADLLKSRIGEAGAAFMRVGARTTDSFPALKAYLEGESAHRAGRWKAAQEAFERAVAADPSFSLAYLRLSDAAGWGLDPEASHDAAEQALQHRGRLSEHDRLLVEAQFACVSGAADDAERRYRTLLGVYPEDWQAWWWLGETLYHFNPLRGRSVREAREPLERALALDPTMWEPLTHLMHVAAIDGDRPRLRSLLERYLGFEASSEGTIRQRALGAFALGDRASQEAMLADLARASDFELGLTPDVVLHGGDLRAAEEVARLLTDPTRAVPMRATGHAKLAHLALARGRWAEAEAELAAAARFDPATALEYRALLSATSFLRLPRVELEELRAEVARWDAAVPASDPKSAWSSPHEGRHVELRSYLLGTLSARLGDSEAVLRNATELEGRAGSVEARALAGSLRAQAARLRGEAAEALVLIEKAALHIWLEYPLASPFWSQAYERFLRAELLQDLGRHEEALGWYATFEEHTVFDRVYHAPALLRSGEIYEEIGEREKARDHYERFAALWEDSDPELRPLVAEAEERLRGIDAPSSRLPSRP